jgi:hypothetical protein
MKTFIDESGSFGWQNPGRSIFCGISIRDRDFPNVLDRFLRWRRSIIGHSRRELKGSELTENQLVSFASKVLPGSDKQIWLTVVGIDTARTRREVIVRLREQASAILQKSSEISGAHGNLRLKESYRQMSGWMNSRSPENLLWVIGLEQAVIDTLQHTIVRFLEPEDDSEFEDFRIYIDQSFIRREEHAAFWREWLRNQLGKSSNKELTMIPNTWRLRSHPFIRQYEIHPGLLDLNHLFVRNTGFFRSEKIEGLQIADICAHILFRYHRGNGGDDAYGRIRARIVGRDGVEIKLMHVDESSLHKDDPRNHAGVLDIEEYKAKADSIRNRAEPS